MRRVAVLFASVALGAVALSACQKKAETAAAAPGEPAAATAAAPAPMAGPPTRKAGLWSQTVQAEGVGQSMKVCLDADTDKKMTVWGQAAGKDACARQSFAPAPGGYSFESECDLGPGGKVVSKGSITGDFGSAYTVKVSSTTTGASMPQANGAHEMTMTAKWEGPCPAGMKGGDVAVTLPGGRQMTINMEQMTAMAGGGQK